MVTKSYPTLCDPMDCSPPGSSVHRISQARILEWVAISFSKPTILQLKKKCETQTHLDLIEEKILLSTRTIRGRTGFESTCKLAL